MLEDLKDAAALIERSLKNGGIKFTKTRVETPEEVMNALKELKPDVILSKITDVNVEKLIGDTFESVKHLKGNDHIIKHVDVVQDSPFYCDAHRLSVIFNNLITNSIQYRDERKPKQEIRICATINPAYASITFQDNGIGIASEHLSQVFNMFFRGTEKSQGAGLGLCVVKEMIDKLKGKVTLSSVLNQRTAVSLTIPNGLLRA